MCRRRWQIGCAGRFGSLNYIWAVDIRFINGRFARGRFTCGRWFVGVSLGVSLEDLLVAGSLKAPFVSRALVTRLYINCELRFFYQSASSVACALHLLVGSFCWSNSTRPAEVFKFNTNKKRRSFILTYSNMIVSDHYNLSMYIMVVYDET
jgi:hypothetical protein